MQPLSSDRMNPVTAPATNSAHLTLPPLRRAEQADPMATTQRLQYLFRRLPPDQQPDLLVQALYAYRGVTI